MRRSVSRIASAVIVLTVLLAIAAGSVGITLSLDAERASASALNTYIPAATTLNQLLAAMVDQESGERGYVITAQPQFLEPYNTGRSAVRSLVPPLRRDLSADPAARSVLKRAVRRYTVWLHSFAMPQVADVQRGNVQAAIRAEKSGRGKTLFDSLRKSMTRLASLIDARQASEVARVKSLQAGVVWLVVGIVVLAVVGSVWGYALLRRWIIRPVQSLRRSIEKASPEDAVVMASAPVEIASLGVSIEDMRRRIREQSLELGAHRHVVSVLQEALLPQRLGRFDGFEFAARYLPAPTETGIGGDWYNVRQAGSRRLFVAIGDVAGKGVDAAALMASLRFAINAFASEDPDPGSVLTRLSALADLAATDRFATVIACLFDADADTARIASAGHLSPVLVSRRNSSVLPVVAGPPIGVGRTAYTSATALLAPDAKVLLFSDGLVERRGEALDQSIERLTRQATPEMAIDQLVEYLVAARGANRMDDTIVCAVRALPSVADAPRPSAVPTQSEGDGDPSGAAHGSPASLDTAGRADRRPVMRARDEPGREETETTAPDLPVPQRFAREFPFTPQAVTSARRFTNEVLRRWEVSNEDAALIVAELASNAVHHARSPFTVALQRDVDVVRIFVTDSSPDSPTPREPTLGTVEGRGLLIVKTLASDWGYVTAGPGKTVWAEVLVAARERA